MPEITQSPNTVIFVSPGEYEPRAQIAELPSRLDVVPPFFVDEEHTTELMRKLASPLLRNQFEISCLETKIERNRVLQRIGGSALHDLRDRVVEVLNGMELTSLEPWENGTTDTWYGGNWKVPEKRTLITRVTFAHRIPDMGSWQTVSKGLKVPNTEFVTGFEIDTPRYRKLMGLGKK